MAGRPTDRRSRRPLADDERALFERLMRGVAPLDPAQPPPQPSPSPPRAPRPKQRATSPPIPGAADDVAPIDRRTARKVERGAMAIEARLDLHGDYQATAHDRLRRFVVEQATAGKRCVLVITGKGEVAPERHDRPQRGVLRRQVPMWLAAPDLRPYVMGLRPAARQHGGAGAYYLLLRKPK
jgi:DNA-nicking Smr family endonuclease